MKVLFALLCFSGIAAAANGAPPVLTACNSGGVTGTSMTCVVGTVPIGNSVVCFAHAQSTSATATFDGSTGETAGWISNPTGFPKRGSTTSLYAGYLLRAIHPGGSTTARVTFNTSVTGEMSCAAYNGIQKFDQSLTASGTSGTALATAAITTPNTNEMVVAGGMVKTGSLTFTAGSGMTVEKQRAGGSESVVLEDMNTSTAGSYTPAATASGSGGEWTFGALAFQTLDSNLYTAPIWRATQGGIQTSAVIGANQGVARTDTLMITSSCYNSGCADTSHQFKLTSWNMDANGMPTTQVETRDCSGDAPGGAAFTQLNGIFYRSDTGHIYVSAADYGASANSYIIEYDPTSLVTGGPLATHTLRALDSEGVSWNASTGTWFAYYVDTNNVDEYNASWSLIRTHSVPTGPPEPGFQWQAFIFDTDGTTAYGNPHNQNTNDSVWVYHFDGSDFQYLGTFSQIDVGSGGNSDHGTGQGMFLWRNQLYWVDRGYSSSGILSGAITKETWPRARRVGR